MEEKMKELTEGIMNSHKSVLCAMIDFMANHLAAYKSYCEIPEDTVATDEQKYRVMQEFFDAGKIAVLTELEKKTSGVTIQ